MRENIIKKRGYAVSTVGDELSLEIASYPVTARYLAKRLGDKKLSLCELCCGIGISLIELSSSFRQVTGVDDDSLVIDACKKNLEAANIENYHLIKSDVSNINTLGQIKADIVLYDIPYWSDHGDTVDPERQNPDLQKLVEAIRLHMTENIVIYSPPHITYGEINSIVGPCEFTEIWVDGRHDRNFVFLGTLPLTLGISRIELSSSYFDESK
jgi:predicted RNA methylase